MSDEKVADAEREALEVLKRLRELRSLEALNRVCEASKQAVEWVEKNNDEDVTKKVLEMFLDNMYHAKGVDTPLGFMTMLDALAPEHTGIHVRGIDGAAPCSDAKLEPHATWDGAVACPRCFLLAAMEDKKWPAGYRIEITITN